MIYTKGWLRGILYLLPIVAVIGTYITIGCSQQESTKPAMVVSGEIVSADLEKSSLVIKYLKDEENQIFEEVTVQLGEIAIIEKGSEIVGISDLAAGDKVNLEYITDENGKNIANYIFVESKE